MQMRNLKITQSVTSRNSQYEIGRSQENKLAQYRVVTTRVEESLLYES